jgi:hypothetical protein
MLDSDGEGTAVLRIVKSNYTSTAYAVELKTHHGIPQSGKVRRVTDLDAERTETKSAKAPKPNGERGGKAPKPNGNQRQFREGT